MAAPINFIRAGVQPNIGLGFNRGIPNRQFVPLRPQLQQVRNVPINIPPQRKNNHWHQPQQNNNWHNNQWHNNQWHNNQWNNNQWNNNQWNNNQWHNNQWHNNQWHNNQWNNNQWNNNQWNNNQWNNNQWNKPHNNYAIYQFGAPKSGSEGGKNPDHVISRTLMRYPNKRVRESLEILHARMKSKFSSMSDESLDWLLGGSRQMSRGGFRTVQEFRSFLSEPVVTIPSSRLISGLETIMTAMGYRAIGASWTENPVARTPDQKKMEKLIKSIVEPEKVDSINKVYQERAQDDAGKPKKGVIVLNANRVSNASHVAGKAKQPIKRMDDRFFRKYVNNSNIPSWIKRAIDQGINVRAHTSGTAPLACAAVKGLLRKSNGSGYALDGLDERNLYTALLIPQFQRSDFHSIAETQAGIDYFMQEYAYQKHLDPRPAVVEDPKVALQRAISAMIDCTSDEIPAGQRVSPKQAMNEFKKEILK